MRIRTLSLIFFILLIAGFVALNWSEFMRPTELSLGFAVYQAPLGLVMVGLLVLTLLLFILASAYQQTRYLMDASKLTRDVQAQRELADKAEASRFTELRQYLEQMKQDELQRESTAQGALRSEMNAQTERLVQHITTSGNTLAAYIGELEDRLHNPKPLS